MAAVAAFWLLAAACTSNTTAEQVVEDTAPVEIASTAASTTPATAFSDLVVDIGVDVENGVMVAAMVGPDEATRAGHRAYWASVNLDLGGIGGELDVELLETDTATDAFTAGVAVISLDQGPVEPVGEMFAVAPEQTIDAKAAGRTLDVTRPTLGKMVSVAARLAADEEFEGEGELGVAAGASCPFDPMTYQLTAGMDAGFVLVCGTPDEARELMREISGVVLLTNEAWSPDLARDLPEVVYILGAIPEPGTDAPAVDILAAVIEEEPWDPGFVRGYTAALTTHLVLERAYQAGDLTRSGILAEGRSLGDADVGFGPPGTVTVAVPDDSSATGLRTVDRIVPGG